MLYAILFTVKQSKINYQQILKYCRLEGDEILGSQEGSL